MKRIYVSYRPQDGYAVEALAQRILQLYGLSSLFINPAYTCHPEADLETCIRDRMTIAQEVLIVVGQAWAGIDEYGRFRLHRADLPVYAEVRWALANAADIRLVLVNGARLPDPDVLPESMHGILSLPVVTLRPDHPEDLNQLMPQPTLRQRFKYWMSLEWTRHHTIREDQAGV